MESTGTVGPRLNFWEYISIVRTRWRWLLAFSLLVPMLALAAQSVAPTNYRAISSVLLVESAAQSALDSSSVNSGILSRRLENEISLALGVRVRAEAQSQLMGIDPDKLNVQAAPGSDVLQFDVTESSPERAADSANVWAQAYVEVKRQDAADSIGSALTALEARLAELTDERIQIRAPLTEAEKLAATAASSDEAVRRQIEADLLASSLEAQLSVIDARIVATAGSISDLELTGELASSGSAQVLEPAIPPVSSTKLSSLVTLALGLIIGVAMGFAAAVFSSRVDRKLNSVADVEALGLRVVGTVPEFPGERGDLAQAMIRDPDGAVAGSYQRVRSALQFAILSGGHKTIVVTSAMVAEGKTSSSCNIAVGLAQSGKSVTLIDGDLRRPQVGLVFGIDPVPGLAECSRNFSGVKKAMRSVGVGNKTSLRVMPAGRATSRPADILVSSGFDKALQAVQEISDIVIIDSPPILPVADALALSQKADAVVLVARRRRTLRSELAHAVQQLEQVNAEVLGVIFVGVEQVQSYYQDA